MHHWRRLLVPKERRPYVIRWIAVIIVIILVGDAIVSNAAPHRSSKPPHSVAVPTVISLAAPPGIATPTVSLVAQADFRNYVGILLGLTRTCLASVVIAQDAYSDTVKGGDNGEAAHKAQVAGQTCDQVKVSFAMMNAPDSLAPYQIDADTTNFFSWATDESVFWGDVRKALLDPHNATAQADSKRVLQDVSKVSTAGFIPLATASTSLGIPLTSITPIVPTPVP